MLLDDITRTLTELFGSSVETLESGLWQVETPAFRLLILLSEDQSWLRMLVPIAPGTEARPFLEQLLVANFDRTQETRYALYQDTLWAVFQHNRATLAPEDFAAAVQRLILLKEEGLADPFRQLRDTQIRQIIRIAKQQGQSLAATLQGLDRFYEEGMMGDMSSGPEYREQILEVWRFQLERLWPEVND